MSRIQGSEADQAGPRHRGVSFPKWTWFVGATCLLAGFVAYGMGRSVWAQYAEPLPPGGASDLQFGSPEPVSSDPVEPEPKMPKPTVPEPIVPKPKAAESASRVPAVPEPSRSQPADPKTKSPPSEEDHVPIDNPSRTNPIPAPETIQQEKPQVLPPSPKNFVSPKSTVNRPSPAAPSTLIPSGSEGGYVVDSSPTVQFISEPVLGFEESGIITKIPKEGTEVHAGDVIATMDDHEMALKVEIAKAELAVAKKEASNQVKVRYAAASAEASEADYQSGLEANKRSRNVVPEMELRKRKLEWKAGLLSVENANYELEIASLSSLVKQAQLDATQFAMKRMKMICPISGIVIKREAHDGQFVRVGDPVLQVAQLDRMRVEAYIPTQDFSPKDVLGRRVSLEIHCGRDPRTLEDRMFACESTIQHVDAIVSTNDSYKVWAEFDNSEDFIVRNGMPVTMVIH